VSAKRSRRRLRLRRRRKGETFSKVLDTPDVVEVADAVAGVEAGDVVEVVGHMGCCVVEAVGGLAVLLALLTVPVYLLLTRVT
jgi:hypothetical protein